MFLEQIESPGCRRVFYQEIEIAESRNNKPDFEPNTEKFPPERMAALDQISRFLCFAEHNRHMIKKNIFCSFFSCNNRGAKIIRAWHGTSGAVARRILQCGFASLSKMDGGWFGKGIYFTSFPEYPYMLLHLV